MKLDIEITEDEIKSAIERKVQVAIADANNKWGVDEYIKKKVATYWSETTEKLIAEAVADSERLKEKIATEIEKKIRSQLTAAIKAKG